MGTEGGVARKIVGRLMDEPDLAVDDLLADLSEPVFVLDLAQSLRILAAGDLGVPGQRTDIARALVNALDGPDRLDVDQRAFVASALRVALNDHEWLVRAWASEGLGVVGEAADASLLRDLARNPDEHAWVRSDALASAFVLDRDEFIEALIGDTFNTGSDRYFDILVRLYRAILTNPDLMPREEEIRELHVEDEELILRYLNQIVIVHDIDPSAPGLAFAKIEVGKLLEPPLSPVVSEYVLETLSEIEDR